ncbi:hypothetical protein [Qipengyuania sp.]|uniref:hypothetical protein n=1 Tax=Qipengyuania sp. TaxID=2004515 RepID=UPI0035C859D9
MSDYLPGWILFAAEATVGALWGVAFLAVALVAFVMDRRRHRRDRVGRPDSVGWVPWTGVFLSCAVLGVGLLAASVPALIRS